MDRVDASEPRGLSVRQALGVFAMAVCLVGCAPEASPSPAFVPPSLEAPTFTVPAPIRTDAAYPLPLPILTETPSPIPEATTTPPPPTEIGPTATPTDGVYEGWPRLEAPTIVAMAQEVIQTMEATNQVELAQKELPDWYLSNVVSIVFRDDFAEGFTGIRIDAASFSNDGQVDPNYEYYLTAAHADEVVAKKQNLTIKDIANQSEVFQKGDWKFSGDPSGMGVLAIKKDSPLVGVSKDHFTNGSDWDPNYYSVNKIPFTGLCYPYPDRDHAFAPLFVKTTLDDFPLIRYESAWQLAFNNPTAVAASGCPILNDQNQIVATQEQFYANGGLFNRIDTTLISNHIANLNSH